MENSQYFKGQSKKSPLMHNEWQIETAVLIMSEHDQFWTLPNVCQTSLMIIR